MSTPIDRSRYVVLPRTTGRRQLALARLLCRYFPPNPSADVEYAGEVLGEALAVVSFAYAEHYCEYGPSIAAAQAELAAVVDALVSVVRDRLDNWQAFERPGVHRLARAQKPGSFDFRQAVTRARVAKQISSLLFPRGQELARRGDPEQPNQPEPVQTLDQLIAAEAIEEDLEDLVGLPFVAGLRECQAQHAERSLVDLREHDTRLARAIQNYAISLLAMLRDDEPESVATIARALGPIDALREALAREQLLSDDDEDEHADPLDPLIDELRAEQDLVDSDLGLTGPAPTNGESFEPDEPPPLAS